MKQYLLVICVLIMLPLVSACGHGGKKPHTQKPPIIEQAEDDRVVYDQSFFEDLELPEFEDDFDLDFADEIELP